MRKKKHSLCILNLILFLGSFLLFSLNSFANSLNERSSSHHYMYVGAKHDASMDASEQASEQTETESEAESEDSAELTAVLLPFFASFFQLEFSHTSCVYSLNEDTTIYNPIYLSIRNFRI